MEYTKYRNRNRNNFPKNEPLKKIIRRIRRKIAPIERLWRCIQKCTAEHKGDCGVHQYRFVLRSFRTSIIQTALSEFKKFLKNLFWGGFSVVAISVEIRTDNSMKSLLSWIFNRKAKRNFWIIIQDWFIAFQEAWNFHFLLYIRLNIVHYVSSKRSPMNFYYWKCDSLRPEASFDQNISA